VNPVRQDYINNIQAIRNDGDVINDDVRYQFRMTSERLPLVLPIYNNGGTLSVTPATANQAPATFANGYNQYANIDGLKSYNYITLTTKIKAGDWLHTPGPIDLSFFMTDNQVSAASVTNNSYLSGVSTSRSLAGGSFPNLFTQQVYDGALMINIIKCLDLLGDIGVETWNSQYTYPLVDYQTNCYGLGLAWDIPWGGGKMEFRYKHIDFADKDLPVNNYSGDQFFTKFKFMF
jgi:hypothetical protein